MSENYRFSILTKRMKGNYSDEELSLMSDKEQRYLNGFMAAFGGTASVQLEDSEGEVRTFTFTSGSGESLVTAVSAPVALNSLVPGLGLAAVAVQKGTVVEVDEKGRFYDDRIDYDISKEQYDTILDDLENNRHRVYNALFRNCATFAVETADKAGLEVPESFIMTPNKLSKKIQNMAAEYERVQGEFSEADKTIDTMFSDREHAPEPTKGRAVTLMHRLNSGPGLGL